MNTKHSVTVSGDKPNVVPMHYMKPGQIGILDASTPYEGWVVLRKLQEGARDPFVILHNGDTFVQHCENKVRILQEGEEITIRVGKGV